MPDETFDPYEDGSVEHVVIDVVEATVVTTHRGVDIYLPGVDTPFYGKTIREACEAVLDARQVAVAPPNRK